jgi:hypothetical protein
MVYRSWYRNVFQYSLSSPVLSNLAHHCQYSLSKSGYIIDINHRWG